MTDMSLLEWSTIELKQVATLFSLSAANPAGVQHRRRGVRCATSLERAQKALR